MELTIVPALDIEAKTSNSISNFEGQGDSKFEGQTPCFVSEEQTSDWLYEFKSALQRHKGQNYVSSDVHIMKLPACSREPSKQYTPQQWQFSLHNRDVVNPSESEDLKIALAEACELEPWDQFCDSVVDDPIGVLRTYGLDYHEPKFSTRQVQYLLTLDALTIFLKFAESLLNVSTPVGARLKTLLKPGLAYNYFWIDLDLLENQIPITLLRNVISKCYVKLIGPNCSVFEQQLLNWILKQEVTFMCHNIFEPNEAIYPQGKLEECPHIFACVYQAMCGKNCKRQSGELEKPIRSATDLKKAGIRIEGINGMLDKVAFQKGCLSLPIVKLYDETESYFRNLAMYEYYECSASNKCAFSEYLQLMQDLIKGPEDVRHVINRGVIENNLKTDISAFEMWNGLQSGLLLRHPSKAYVDMVSKINSQCKSTLNIMRTEFYESFCSRPWYVIAMITATIVTIATCIQAYTAVIGSNKMQPHFQP